MVSFETGKINFDEVQFIYSFPVCASSDLKKKKKLPHQESRRLTAVYSSECFAVLALAFGSLARPSAFCRWGEAGVRPAGSAWVSPVVPASLVGQAALPPPKGPGALVGQLAVREGFPWARSSVPLTHTSARCQRHSISITPALY